MNGTSHTVAKVVKKAAEINLSWPLDHDMTDSALEEMLFPKVKSATNCLALPCKEARVTRRGVEWDGMGLSM